MEHQIEIEEYASHKMIHAYIKGRMSERDRNLVAIEATRKMKENGLTKIIWDIREAELDYSLIGSHMVVMNLEALGLSQDNFVAVIYFHNKEQHEHAETVAINRGIFNIGYFQKLEEGINWLIDKG
jgi:hypothetical protein